MATALEQSFADICSKHDLGSVSFSFFPEHVGTRFTAYAHTAEHLGSGSSDSLNVAIGAALTDLAVRRARQAEVALPDEALRIGEAA